MRNSTGIRIAGCSRVAYDSVFQGEKMSNDNTWGHLFHTNVALSQKAQRRVNLFHPMRIVFAPRASGIGGKLPTFTRSPAIRVPAAPIGFSTGIPRE